MKLSKLSCLSVATLSIMFSCAAGKGDDLTRYVDTYIGTGGHGHVFMGASVPFGMVQLGPTSIPQDWDWTSGYHISDTTVIGFAHTHLSGTGIGDLCDISFMPVIGQTTLNRGKADDPDSGMWSYFSRKNERTSPGYYFTRLDRYGIDVELTATARVGFHNYTFPSSDDARVIIDLKNGNGWDFPMDCYIEQVNDTTVTGYRFSQGWAKDQKVYFTAVFSRPMKHFKITRDELPIKRSNMKSVHIYGEAFFDTKADQKVSVKVAISPVSISNASENMTVELPGWDFGATAAAAKKLWNDELSKIKIESNDESVKRTFYTALYHTMIEPTLFSDTNGNYRGADTKTHQGSGFSSYSTLSLWDTYRAAHPLMTIIHPELTNNIINTMLAICREQGKLPVWHLLGNETNCMVGNPAIPVVADAILKGYSGFDHLEAYNAMKQSAMLDERGLDLLKQYGYIPFDKLNESVAVCMEYALADWALAQVAKKLFKEEDYKYFMERSMAYKHYFDPSTGFIRGLSSTGQWRTPFNPFESVHRENDYTEGTAWQYTFLVPHDVEGLATLFVSHDKFIAKLDSLFIVKGDMGKQASADITGLIGQYAHGNEPSHHIVYLYTMMGQPWKTADKVREILTTLYHDKPDGLSGNEDAGQMSAWYILSSLGFYQVEPAGGRYFFGSPLIDGATLKVRGDKTFTIKVKNNSPQNKYIQSVKLNGKPYNQNFISFDDMMAGGKLEYTMGDKQVKWF